MIHPDRTVSVFRLGNPRHKIRFRVDGIIRDAALVNHAFTPKLADDSECNPAKEGQITYMAWNQRNLLGVRSSLKAWTSHNLPVPRFAAIGNKARRALLVEWPEQQHYVVGCAPFGYRVLGRVGVEISGVWTVAPSDEVGGYTATMPKAPVIKKVKVEKEEPRFVAYMGDPFVITEDGHYMDIGELDKPEDQRFMVPKDFNEFYERCPKYILNWVKKRLNRFTVDADVEDWAQDLIIHMKYLPQTSKHREAGKEDVIQTFDPMKLYGANEARFRSYINRCLANKFMTCYVKQVKNPVCRIETVSLSDFEDTSKYPKF